MFRAFNEIRPTPAVIARVAADVVMLALALGAGFVFRFFWLVEIQKTEMDLAGVLRRFAAAYWQNLIAVICLSLPVFLIFGFYTRGRFYQSRYKVLVVAQAVTVSYLLLAALAYVAHQVVYIPRGVWLLAWLITLGLLITSRIWAAIWRRIAAGEGLDHDSEVLELRGGAPQRVLVIGGAGFVGSALLPQLLGAGYRVRLFDLLLFGEEPIASWLDDPNLEIVRADFRHVHKLVGAMADVDAVIHLGGIVGDPACALDEEITTEINLVSTRVIAELAKGNGIQRFVFASTCSVYGSSQGVLDERSALRPVSLYARSKIASERVLRSLSDHTFQPTVLRFGTIYGLSGRQRFDLVVNLLAAKAVVEKRITVYGGKQWRPFLHVEDAARAIFLVLRRPLSVVGGEVFNVGSNDQNHTIDEVAEVVHRVVPDAEIVNMGEDTDPRNYRVDFSKIRSHVKYSPRWTLEDGVRQVVETIRCGEVQDYRDIRHNNVLFLREETQSQVVRREFDWARLLVEEA